MNLPTWKEHKYTWQGGCGHALCTSATRIVLAKGDVPCDILFVGEGPGRSEDIIGRPFVGPAGQLLDLIVKRAVPDKEHCDNKGIPAFRCAYTNLVCCIPMDLDTKEIGEPEDDQIESCKSRLENFIQLANPRLIVAVGKHAKEWLDQGYRHSVCVPGKVHIISIVHPAAILRQNLSIKGLSIQKCVVTIRSAIEDYL